MLIKDVTGVVHKELIRTPTGAISVGDKNSYDKYMRDKKQIEEIKLLTERLNSLEQLVKSLIEKGNN